MVVQEPIVVIVHNSGAVVHNPEAAVHILEVPVVDRNIVQMQPEDIAGQPVLGIQDKGSAAVMVVAALLAVNTHNTTAEGHWVAGTRSSSKNSF